MSGLADSKTDTGFKICRRFVGVIGQNKIQRTYDHNCISTLITVESQLSVKHLLKCPYKFYAIVTKKANGGIWEEVNNYSGEKIL